MCGKRIRSINQTVQILKEIDPGTALNYNAVKRIIDEGKIASISSGNRRLIVVEDVYQYFYGEPMPRENVGV